MVVKHDCLQSCSVMDQSLMGHRVLTHRLVFKNLEHTFFIWWQVLVRNATLSYNTICIRKWKSFNNDLFCGCLLYGTISRNSLWGKNCLSIHTEVIEIGGETATEWKGRLGTGCEGKDGLSEQPFYSLSPSFPPILCVHFNRFYFLEKFYVHSKIECKVQIFPAPTHT